MVKKMIKALFQMDPIPKLNIDTDSTIFLIREAIVRDIEVWIVNPDDISFLKNKLVAKAKKVKNPKIDLSMSKEIAIGEFDFFFIRQDPPFDMKYITNCYLLEIHNKSFSKPFFINSPTGIKNFTEKIFPLYFNKLMPKTAITSDVTVFKKMLLECGDVVVKPLYNKGGEDIFKLSLRDNGSNKTFKMLISKYGCPLVIQKFIDKVRFGDKRVIIIDSKPVAVINRIPKSGAFKANLHLGGRAEKTKLTNKEKSICKKLKPILKKNKLFFVGIDLIDENLTEINVTSPTGLTQVLDLYDKDLSKLIWGKILTKI